jgi:prephenate dehydrogenase
MGKASSLSSSRVSILGLGLMGGSLALALRGKCTAVYGYDPDEQVLAVAKQMNLADGLTHEPDQFIAESDIIVLAAPVRSILTLLEQLPTFHPGSPVVLDIGSTKLQVLQSMERLPERFDFIGGHPICGKEKSSLIHAEAQLFSGATFVLCPSKRTKERALQMADEMVTAIGSQIVWMDAEEHDSIVAATSHFPYLLSNVMVSVTPLEARKLVGPGFRSTARIAYSSPTMMTDILMTNRINLLNQISRFQVQLEKFKMLIETEDEDQIARLLDEGVQSYSRLVS